jgi:hypothetical protein
MAQIAGNEPQTEPPLHPVLPVRAACAPSIVASQARYSRLDALCWLLGTSVLKTRLFHRTDVPRSQHRKMIR